jgi:hypothetical protein
LIGPLRTKQWGRSTTIREGGSKPPHQQQQQPNQKPHPHSQQVKGNQKTPVATPSALPGTAGNPKPVRPAPTYPLTQKPFLKPNPPKAGQKAPEATPTALPGTSSKPTARFVPKGGKKGLEIHLPTRLRGVLSLPPLNAPTPMPKLPKNLIIQLLTTFGQNTNFASSRTQNTMSPSHFRSLLTLERA